ncbi:T9SS type B sorting domain-containing protein [Lentiprolixibacter aurantiacus]|uniref:T9SS type B sorting domain-containing protein n=1 Tax=Lentiprolixibacter aurantiacus TaxID=2993939 RepID=A0AAE3MIN7_9FLAO|nr:T9SS type B sorting domain-containing protein [Lentiprolixibacter aurantiacus]MCX2718510.1 T9SS type B sorting domain-containing protein [Lentiprolixibacter aurantiacus]
MAQNNPVIDLVETPNNDIDGQVVVCANDGSQLPHIFLCGANDVANLTVSYPGSTIEWQLLDENSCTNFGDNCTNQSQSCTYTTVATGENFPVGQDGKYRLRVNLGNGVFENHYFHVYQNNLDLQYQKADIGCEPFGNITITNLGGLYGFQLVNADNDQVIVPFSANNGPSFLIPGNGNYRIEAKQLDGINGNPIPNSCLFSTPAIPISTSTFSVSATSTEADCSGVATITANLSDGSPNYTYELRLNDGLDGGRGTLVQVVTGQTSDSYTFTGVGQGEYSVVGINSDGCEQSDVVTVAVDPNNTLSFEARVSQHITCKEGNILVDPAGGKPPYRYAIWQHIDETDNLITSYNSPSEIPASEFQTSEIFDILTPGNYTFVLVDRFGCFTISNSVDIEFVPPAEFAAPTVIDQACFGEATGSIQMNLIDDNGYQLTYYLFDEVIPQQDVFSGNFNLNDAIASNLSGFFPGLMQGDYTIVINMRKGSADCDFPYYYSVDGPAIELGGEAILIQPYSCVQTGTIRANNYGGGVSPYEFSLDGASWQTDDMFTGLLPGNYTILMRDALGCVVETNPVEILDVDGPTDLVFSPTPVTCTAPGSDVTVTVVGGTGPFDVQITSPVIQGATSITDDVALFEGLSPGTYTFSVTDTNDCTYQETFTISPITPIGVSGQLISNVTCFGDTNGEITYTVAGFNSSYDYTVTGPASFSNAGETSPTISLPNLAAGTYTIVVTDNETNCTDTTDVTIAGPPAELIISDLIVTDLSCSASGTATGSVSISATGGWGGYEYELLDPSGTSTGLQSNNSFTGLNDTSGDYTVIVRDAGGCEITQTFALSPIVNPVLDITANSLCYDSATGLTLTATVTSGGEAPFQYRLNGGAYQTSPDFTGLGPGSYTIDVIDSRNCTASTSIDVFPTLAATAALVKDLDCSATPNAEISVDISGGNPSFTYEVIRDGSVVQASTAVPAIPFSYFTSTAGLYEFVITDSQGCTVTTNQVVVTDNGLPVVSEVITNPLCDASADGIVELQISGGTPPYQVVFDGSTPSSQTTYAGLTAGNYNYTVTDDKGCQAFGTVTLVAPPALIPGTIDIIQDYRCDNASAILQAINYSGGTFPYEFSLDGVNWQGSDTFNTGIAAGSYTITIRDANGCVAQTPAVVIDPLNPPTDLTFTQTAPTCPAVTADVTVSVVDGTAPYTYEIIAPAANVVNNGNNNVFAGLPPGTYTFQVTDDKGCIIQENYTVADIPQVDAISQLVSNVTCFGDTDGAFTFTVSDFATTYSYVVTNGSAAAVQSQNNINLTTAISVAGLAADTYTVTITDDTTGCSTTTSVVVVGPPAALGFTYAATPVTCVQNGTITVTATDGWGGYEYQLEDTAGPAIVVPYQSSNTFTNVVPGSYNIYVRDAEGCETTQPVTIDPAAAPVIAFATSDLCYDSTNQASLSVSITDGVAPYTYSINGGGQTAVTGNPFTISNLIPGTYDIQVTDAYGCVSNIITETIAPQLQASAIVSKALDCSVSPDAVIDVSINNGYTPYASYEVRINGGGWSAPVALAGNSFSYTTAVDGTFDFRITDAEGCTGLTQAIVAPITTPVISSLLQTADILCNGDAGASIQVTLDTTQGVAPFTISVVNTTTSTNYGTQTSGLPAGTYEVTVTDANSCSDMEVIVIGEPDPIAYDINLVPITCTASGTSLGSITVENLTGGTAGYTYYLTGNNGTNQQYNATTGEDHTFTILQFGIYEVDVVDANGCSVRTTNIIASPPSDLNIDVSALTVDCSAGGTATVTVAAGGSGNYQFGILETYISPYSSSYQGPDAPGGDTATFTSLTPGVTYTFVVFDVGTNCYYFETADAPINSPSNLTSTLDAINNITCTGNADGNVSFTFDNYDAGATAVSYEIFNSQSNTTTGISGSQPVNPPAVGTGVFVPNLGPLPRGIYYILFTEVGGTNNGCSVASAEFTITESTNLLAVTASLERNDNCNLNAGQVSAVGQFGTAPYEYQIALSADPAPTEATWAGSTANVFNVEGGDYIVYVRDANGCIQSDPVFVPTDPSPDITVALNDQCLATEGNYSVDITLDVAGIAPHAIRIDGGAPQAAPGLVNAGNVITVSNLSSGVHTFEIIDQNGCSEIESITIYPPLNIAANITADENCDPANSGEVTVTANGGSGSYSFTQVSPAGPTNPTGIFTGLTHSITYTFEAEDTVTGCTTTVNVVLPAPVIPSFTLSATDVSCFGGSDGSITVTLDPGNIDIPYLYSLDGGTTTQVSNIFTGLAQGNYNVTVISSKGCEDTLPISIAEPSELSISATASAFSCDDSASTITVTINNDGLGNPSGTSPYMYSFDNGANFQSASTIQVPFGSPDVTVVVQDANGCTDTVVVPIPVMQEVTASINPLQAIDCVNGAEIIEIIAADGSGSYNYFELPAGNVVADPSNIVITQPGTYVYEIVDAVTNCSVIVEHIVPPYDLMDVTATVLTDATCSDSTDGIIEVTISGYTGTFNYQVLDSSGGFVAGASGPENATSDPYTFNVTASLPAGSYTVQITQTAYPECIGESNVVTIDAPEPLALQLLDNVNANCNMANAVVTVQATGGTAPYEYGASVSGAGVPATFPFDYTVELDPAVSLNWDIYVRDANGCLVAAPLAVTVDTDTSPDISLAVADECAPEGSFSITVTLNAVNTGIPPYRLSINGSAFQTVSAFPYTYTALNSGPYNIEIRDSNGCQDLENITIEPELSISAFAVTQPSCTADDGVIEFTVGGGSGSNTVELLRSDLTPTGIVPAGNQFTGVAFGDYIVRVTDDTLGTPNCVAEAPVSLEEPTPVTLLATDWTDVSCAGGSDGSITINLEPASPGVNDNPPYTYEITDGTTTITQDTNVFAGLPAGTYDITVTSNRNCIALDQVTISEPVALDAAITNVVPFACDPSNNQSAATIEVTITAGTGTPDYFYSVNGGNFLPTGGNVFTHSVTTAGNYDIVIRDANGCLFPLPTQTIEPLPQIVLDLAVGAADCPTGQEITVTSTGHSSVPATDLTFELLETGDVRPNLTTDSQVFNLTAPGIYTFRVTDNITGCYEIINYEVDPSPQYSVALTAVTPITCFGDTDGTLEVTFTGYAGAYDYEVFNEDGSSTAISGNNSNAHPLVIANVPAGNYFVRVTPLDYPYCDPEDTLVQTVASPSEALDVLIEELMAAGCPDNLGEISVVPQGGYPPYDITLTHSGGQQYTVNDVNAHVFTGLPSGSYTVDVIDAQGCSWTGGANVAPTPPIIASGVGTAAVCYDNPDGTIVVSASGGSGSYNYFINYYDETGSTIEFTPSVPQLSNEFNSLGEGYYSVTVVDNLGCSDTTSIIHLDGPDQLLAELELTTAMTCVDDAVVTLTATGGTAPYEFFNPDNSTWEAFNAGSQHIYSVAEGTHYAQIRDVNNCQYTTQVPVVINPIPDVDLIIEYASPSVNCADSATASIYAYAVGGIGNYTFDLMLNGGLVTSVTDPRSVIFENLSPGNYTVIATSEGGCNPDQETVIIANPAPLIFSYDADNVSCNGNEDGAITLMLSGGGGGYQYAISPNLDQFFEEDPEQGLPAGQYRFEDLSPGTYTVIVQDANGCFYVEDIEIIDPDPITITPGIIEPVVCSGEANGSISISIEGGTAPYRTAFNSNADGDFVDLGDNPTFDSLEEGTYAIFVRDANDCENVVVLEVPGGVNLNATVAPLYECTGNIPGNYVNITMEDPTVLDSIMYALDSTDPADMQLNPDFRDLAPGSHYIAISHTNGCVRTFDFEIDSYDALTLSLEQNNINEITAVAAGGLPPYTFYFNDDNNGSDNTYYINRTGTYTVRVVDQLGCEVQAQVSMEFIDIEIPNFFTPDGDGMNDTWMPDNMEGFPEILIKIYDRYGRVVAEEAYGTQGWDGKYHGNDLPTGDYWYVIKLNGENDDREFVGHFTLYR